MERTLSELTRAQAALLGHYLEAVGESAEGVEVYRVAFKCAIGGFAAGYWVVKIGIGLEDGSCLNFYGSLGDSEFEAAKEVDHEHQFVGIFDSGDPTIPHLIAYARNHHLFLGHLDVDHTFLLAEDDPLRRSGYVAALVTSIDLYPPLRGKGEVRIVGVENRILGLLPLSMDERDLKVRCGSEALFTAFRESERDLLVLAPCLDA